MLLEGSQSMRGYGRVDEDLDEYEDDLDEYGADHYEDEDDGEEHEEEEEAVPEEKLRYLDLRQKLKEEARSKIRKENGDISNKSQDRKGASSLGKFGSFFGPSRPVVADRVIQESKSFLETRHLTNKQSTPVSDGKKAIVSSISEPKNRVSNKPFSNQVKTKAQMIKQTRDFYSSLLSDDVEIPKPGGDSYPQKNIVSKTDTRPAQVPAKSSKPSSSSSRKGLNGYEHRKPSSGTPQSRSIKTPVPQKLISGSRPSLLSSDSKRQLDLRKQPQSNKQLSSSNDRGPVKSAAPKVLPPKKLSNTNDKKAPVGTVERKSFIPAGSKASTVVKKSISNGQRPPPVKSQTCVISNRVVNRRDVQHSREGNMLKENNPASKLQIVKPPRQDAVRSNLGKDRYSKEQKPLVHKSNAANKDHYNKKRRVDEAFSDEEIDYRSVIRGMFGRPRHYEDVDDDDDDDDMCMEVGFDAILQEEKRSARIAKKEDDEELVKIMEEERQERLRKQAKLRKKNQR